MCTFRCRSCAFGRRSHAPPAAPLFPALQSPPRIDGLDRGVASCRNMGEASSVVRSSGGFVVDHETFLKPRDRFTPIPTRPAIGPGLQSHQRLRRAAVELREGPASRDKRHHRRPTRRIPTLHRTTRCHLRRGGFPEKLLNASTRVSRAVIRRVPTGSGAWLCAVCLRD